MISVVTVYAPRRRHSQWKDYLPYLDVQRKTCEKFGHRHVVVTDAPPDDLKGLEALPVRLPDSLMFAQIAGQQAWLDAWDDADHTVFVDADVLIGRDLARAFDGSFDLGLTNRDVGTSPINNGVMYIAAGSRAVALRFWQRAYALCEDHWGGDQEAIAKAAAPVPVDHGIERRDLDGTPARIYFMPHSKYNMTPGVNGEAGVGAPFAIHFKGDRKNRMRSYARAYIF